MRRCLAISLAITLTLSSVCAGRAAMVTEPTDRVHYVVGDVNDDGAINNRDLATLQGYLNEWEVAIHTLAADANGDGGINNRDLGALERYVNDWDVTLAQPSSSVYDFVNEGVGNLTIADQQGAMAQCEYVSLEKRVGEPIKFWSDFTFIQDRLWVFFGSGDDEHRQKDGFIHLYDPDDGSLQKTFYHDFGHVNTVDYNERTDQLLIGNLPGTSEYPAALYVFDNVSSWIDEGDGSLFLFEEKVSTIVDITDIVRSGTSHAHATVACWGDEDNTVYVTGSYNLYWWKIMLGRGDDDLGKGLFVPTSASLLNGSYKVMWMRQFTPVYSAYQECIQGMIFNDGHLYTVNGHHEIQWWMWTLRSNNSLVRLEHNVFPVDNQGEIRYCVSEGIAIYNGYVYIGCLFSDRGLDDYNANHGVCTGDHGVIKVKV